MKLRPFRLERYFAEHEFTAPYLLCSSDCESLSVGDLLALEDGAEERLRSLWLGYTESPGAPELREAIAGLYDDVPADGILVHAGAEEAIFNFMNVALGKGDEVVVHTPCYQSLAEVARAAGANVIEWPGDPQRGWALDLGFLEDAVTPRTRVVVVNCPHNPTGFYASPELWHGLAELSRKNGFLVFSDEVYRGLEHDPSALLPAFADLDENAVSLGVMSKTYGLAGLRIGWIATRNRELHERMAAFKDYTTICNSAPGEFLATLALRHRDVLVRRNLEIIRSNLDRLDAFFAAHEELFGWYRPSAGPIAFPKLRQGSVDDFCRDAVREAGVLLLPGTLYGDGSNAFRVGFGRKNLPEALERLAEFVAPKRVLI